ncbi:MAG: hypothetical protein GY938_26665 [Ketobacter sp.]|nr:hypothetical protein [Ketobacter sp.]
MTDSGLLSSIAYMMQHGLPLTLLKSVMSLESRSPSHGHSVESRQRKRARRWLTP